MDTLRDQSLGISLLAKSQDLGVEFKRMAGVARHLKYHDFHDDDARNRFDLDHDQLFCRLNYLDLKV